MNKRFKVGDRVRIRQWDDMEREFGSVDGVIACRYMFSPAMESLCGYEFTIHEITVIDMIKASDEESSNAPTERSGGLNAWNISEDMLERVIEAEDEYDTEALNSFIGSLIGE